MDPWVLIVGALIVLILPMLIAVLIVRRQQGVALGDSPDPARLSGDWRIVRLERRVDRLAAALGIEEDPAEDLELVRALLRAGRTIQAIRAYRELRGVGLEEARAAVEALERELRSAEPP